MRRFAALCAALFGALESSEAFAPSALPTHNNNQIASSTSTSSLFGHPTGGSAGGGGGGTATVEATGFIDTELRGAAMRLHTFSQAPREGRVQEAERKPYTPTREDYLHFLVDSQHVYRAFEEVMHTQPELEPFCDTGLERADALEDDITYMMREYGMERPEVGSVGREYAEEIRNMAKDGRVPELICHYYNHYFAHTAGGLMIGKKMSSLLFDDKILQFYKWKGGDGEVIEGRKPVQLLDPVRAAIEDMAAEWSAEEKARCVDETANTFKYGGALTGYLNGQAAN